MNTGSIIACGPEEKKNEYKVAYLHCCANYQLDLTSMFP